MPQAIMDPEEVRRFAKELKRFNDDVQTRASALQARFTALSGTWQDQEAEKFAEEFISTMKVLRKFVEVSEQHTPYLLRKGAAHRRVSRSTLIHGRADHIAGSPRDLSVVPHRLSHQRPAQRDEVVDEVRGCANGFSMISACIGKARCGSAARFSMPRRRNSSAPRLSGAHMSTTVKEAAVRKAKLPSRKQKRNCAT
jgi:uncharacterized protein YukE